MDQVHVIRHKVLVEGQSARETAKSLGVSRNTVRKYLSVSEPKRVERSPRRRPVFDKVKPRIDALLSDWSSKTTTKQRVTAVRLHEALRAEGFDVGITLIRDVLKERRRRDSEGFVPLVHRAGDEAQVDFFEVTLDVSGRRVKAWMFLMRLMYSGRDFVWLYERCDQLAFLDGHVRAFEHFGKIPQRLVYDNLSAAVKKVTRRGRVLTGRFQALVNHYLFEPCFARVGVGHDKGGVESRGKSIRLRHLVPIPSGASHREIAAQLLSSIDSWAQAQKDKEGRTVWSRFEEDFSQMQSLPPYPFEVCRAIPVSVTRSALVRVEGAWYSVPCHLRQLSATAYVGVDDVRIVCRGEEVTHPRVSLNQKQVLYRHYLPELAKKPQAVRQVVPELLAELGAPYGQLWSLLVDTYGPKDAGRTFARVLGAVHHHGSESVASAIEAALVVDDVDSVFLHLPKKGLERPASIAIPESLAGYDVEGPQLRSYDALLAGGDVR